MTADPILIVDEDVAPESPYSTFRVSRANFGGSPAVRIIDGDGDTARIYCPVTEGIPAGVVSVAVDSEGASATAYVPARLLAEEALRLIGEALPAEEIPPQVVSDEAAALISWIRSRAQTDISVYGGPVDGEDSLTVTDRDGDEVRVEPSFRLSDGAAYLVTGEDGNGAYLTAAQARDFAAILTACADRAEGVTL